MTAKTTAAATKSSKAKTATKGKATKAKAKGTKKATGEAKPVFDVYQGVTDRICAALEGGQIPWRKGWSAYGVPRNYATGEAYQGINAFLLCFCPVAEYPLFMTYKQAEALGGQVRKGEHGEKIVKAAWVEGKQGKDGKKKDDYFMLKSYTVFNISQIDGIDWVLPEKIERVFEPNEAAEVLASKYLNQAGAPTLAYGGSRAYYAHESDHIQMPPRVTFRSTQAYYRTLFHELGHSTGAAKRLNRSEVVKWEGKGSASYAREELTAEMCTAFLNAELGYAPEQEGDQHASYIQNWLTALKNDKTLVVKAARLGQKAAYLIKGETPPAYGREIEAPAAVLELVEAD
jgi:antirestriction protein ArdC